MNTNSNPLVRYEAANGSHFYCTPEQAEALDTLKKLHKGGIGTVYGYRPTTGYTVRPVLDMQIITRFSLNSLYERKQAALDAITLDDVQDSIKADPVLSKLTFGEVVKLFNERKDGAVASMQKTLDGDRGDSHRQGHDRCYAVVADGVKVNFECVKEDGLMQPVIPSGFDAPVAESILVSYLELNRVYVEQGERKVVNSGAPVRMSNAIEKVLNKRSVGLKMLSLKPDNFDKLKISRTTILAEDLESVPEPQQDDWKAILAAWGLAS